MNTFIQNIVILGFANILQYALILLLVHQVLAWLLAKIEEMLGMEVKFYWYDIPIALIFIFTFVYGIYSYKID